MLNSMGFIHGRFLYKSFLQTESKDSLLNVFLWGRSSSREKKAGGVQENARGLTQVTPGTHSRVHLMSLRREIKPWSPVGLGTLADYALLDKKIYSTCLTSPRCGLLINSYYVTIVYKDPLPDSSSAGVCVCVCVCVCV